MDFKDLSKFSFKKDSVWKIVFGLLPLVVGILILLVIMLLREV